MKIEKCRGCLDFATERISGPGRGIFVLAERGMVGALASEARAKSTGRGLERPRVANFKQPLKVLLYPKKSSPDKSGKTPIMGRITVNNSMAQFSCKLSCSPELWNPRESRLNGKSKEAVETNARIEKLLLAINTALDTLTERK